MQQNQPLPNQLLQILQQLEKEIDRKEFCKFHRISKSKLSRILSGKSKVDLELLYYLAMDCGYTVNLSMQKSV
jgi:transcriptional regulator with XRE-family HTH domain